MLKSAFPDATGQEIVEALRKSAIGQGGCGRDVRYGHGQIDVKRAADYLLARQNGEDVEDVSCQDIEVRINTDNCGSETIWDISRVFVDDTDPDANLVFVPFASGGPYLDSVETEVIANVSVPADGCYAFQIWDLFGDG